MSNRAEQEAAKTQEFAGAGGYVAFGSAEFLEPASAQLSAQQEMGPRVLEWAIRNYGIKTFTSRVLRLGHITINNEAWTDNPAHRIGLGPKRISTPLPNTYVGYVGVTDEDIQRFIGDESPRQGAQADRSISTTFTNEAPYGVDFFLNGSGPLSRPLRLEVGGSHTWNLVVAPGFSPYVRVRQPDTAFREFRLLARAHRYRLRRTPQNQVECVPE